MLHTARQILIRIALALMIVTLILGCSCTKPKLGTLIGTIQLVNDSGDPANDPADFSGVSIALYAPAVLDTAIVRANIKYPGVGFAISQETEFDHREHTALYTASSAADGSFNLAEIEPGRYNIVLSKAGWGWRYLLDCMVGVGENTLSEFVSGKNNQATILYPERTISYNDQIQSLKADHFYKVESDVVLIHNLSIERGAYLLLTPLTNLTLIGNLTTQDNESGSYAKVLVEGSSVELDSAFGKVMVQGNVEISGVVFSNSLTGVQFTGGSVVAADIRVKNGSSGLMCRNCVAVDISNAVVSGIGQLITSGANIYSTDGGLDLTSCDNSQVRQSVLSRCNSGVKVREFCDTNVHDCYFFYNTIGAEGLVNTAIYEHNEYLGNYSYDIRVYGTCSPIIRKNNFQSTRGVNIGLNTLLAFLNCNPLITRNNFNCEVFAIRIMGNNMIDVDATNNYFYSTNFGRLEELIWDQNDYNPHDWSNQIIQNTAYINYIPFLNNKVPDAGIRM
ncbi:MAG TPA: hypothetical protein PLM19_01775 [Candidatus Syntrophosphaera sp.]|nr:hypothetical protein [Candidatus Cloacimonadota bacterium]HOR02717.1 hypothetical protein [Candidatus Syntrophosphaera sp.]